MEHVPPETFMALAATLMPGLTRGRSEARRERRFRAKFGTNAQTCADLWCLCYSYFTNTTVPLYLLWALMFMKCYNAEEVNASNAGVHEDTFRDWVWHVISVIDRVNYVSLTACVIAQLIFYLD